MNKEERHIFSVMVENRFGVLARVVSLFSGRGFNIDSLNVAETHDKSVSQITLVTHGDAQIIEQIYQHLNRLIDVIEVTDLSAGTHVEREIVLIKVSTDDAQKRTEILQTAEVFRGRVIDMKPASLVLEITGDEGKLEAAINIFNTYGILELARTGKIAMSRGVTN
ncbi:MAG: acetolactate synthase small subunit [Candidatus Poribacteria bacterium]|nr:acetolactate synthase small subunit [Candidatus Poribacteria bacterium]